MLTTIFKKYLNLAKQHIIWLACLNRSLYLDLSLTPEYVSVSIGEANVLWYREIQKAVLH